MRACDSRIAALSDAHGGFVPGRGSVGNRFYVLAFGALHPSEEMTSHAHEREPGNTSLASGRRARTCFHTWADEPAHDVNVLQGPGSSG